jgi:NitT/TauT family transport system substrate-binding protein
VILLNQIKLTLDYFDTPATQGKPIGWQSKEDWEAALKSMQDAGVVSAGANASDYYTNALVE